MSKFLKSERVVSPLHPVQTPALKEDENPNSVKSRLEREEGDLLEAIGDLVVRQNGLVGKKSNIIHLYKNHILYSIFGRSEREYVEKIKTSF